MSSLLPLLYCSCKCKSKFESYTTHCHILNKEIYVQKGLDPEELFTKGGGGALKTKALEPTAQAATWEAYERGIDPPLIKIFASENAFQAI